MENDFFADTRTQLNILVVDDNQVNLKIMLAESPSFVFPVCQRDDDYLGKPVDIVLLLAKINAMQRIAVLEYKLRVSNLQLQSYRDKSELDLDMARELIEQMVAGSSTQLADVELWRQPAENLGGDLLITQQFGQKKYLLLADAMGHGWSAAFPLVPLVQVFSDMSRAGNSVAEIVQVMNARLSNLLPVDNFVAATLISWDRAGKMLEIWNGGNPAMLLTDSSGAVSHQFESRHMALGICREDDFDASTETFVWRDACCLTLYSDGVTDAENAAGVKFGEKGIVEALKNTNSHLALQKAVIKHINDIAPSDDISLATIYLQ